jgi:hypothetical protein
MNVYECIVCDYNTVRKNNLMKHYNTINHKMKIKNNNTENGNKNKNYNCESCLDTFSNEKVFKTHTTKCMTNNDNNLPSSNKNMVSATSLHEKKLKNEPPENNQKLFCCNKCDYVCSKKGNYNRHMRSSIHNNIEIVYECGLCKFKTGKKSNYNIHLQTKKHLDETNKSNDTEKNMINKLEEFKTEVVKTLMGQLSSVLEENHKNILSEQTKMNQIITEIANKPPSNNLTNIHNNTQNKTNNQQFNMNMFLNETCKDAMNMSEFIETLHVSMDDMEKTGELGFAKGMSRIIMNNLNAIDVCKRPIHCSDAKRETLYVKNNGVWEKETQERTKIKEIIYKVSCLNERQLIKWRDLPRNKGYEKSDHHKNDEFINLVMEINKMRDEEIDKVIKTISKHVTIDKIKMSGYLN